MSARTVYVSVDWDGEPIGVYSERYMAELSRGEVFEMEVEEPPFPRASEEGGGHGAQEDQG